MNFDPALFGDAGAFLPPTATDSPEASFNEALTTHTFKGKPLAVFSAYRRCLAERMGMLWGAGSSAEPGTCMFQNIVIIGWLCSTPVAELEKYNVDVNGALRAAFLWADKEALSNGDPGHLDLLKLWTSTLEAMTAAIGKYPKTKGQKKSSGTPRASRKASPSPAKPVQG